MFEFKKIIPFPALHRSDTPIRLPEKTALFLKQLIPNLPTKARVSITPSMVKHFDEMSLKSLGEFPEAVRALIAARWGVPEQYDAMALMQILAKPRTHAAARAFEAIEIIDLDRMGISGAKSDYKTLAEQIFDDAEMAKKSVQEFDVVLKRISDEQNNFSIALTRRQEIAKIETTFHKIIHYCAASLKTNPTSIPVKELITAILKELRRGESTCTEGYKDGIEESLLLATQIQKTLTNGETKSDLFWEHVKKELASLREQVFKEVISTVTQTTPPDVHWTKFLASQLSELQIFPASLMTSDPHITPDIAESLLRLLPSIQQKFELRFSSRLIATHLVDTLKTPQIRDAFIDFLKSSHKPNETGYETEYDYIESFYTEDFTGFSVDALASLLQHEGFFEDRIPDTGALQYADLFQFKKADHIAYFLDSILYTFDKEQKQWLANHAIQIGCSPELLRKIMGDISLSESLVGVFDFTLIDSALTALNEPSFKFMIDQGLEPSARFIAELINNNLSGPIRLASRYMPTLPGILFGDQNMLLYATTKGSDDCLKILVEMPAASKLIDEPSLLHPRNTALGLSLEKNKAGCCAILLKHGAKTNIPSAEGFLPIHIGAFFGNNEALKVLISERKSTGILNARDRVGETALFHAAKGNQKKTLQLLLDEGADPHAVSLKNSNGLHVAAEKDADTVIPLLLAEGVDITRIDNDGMTPIHVAAYHNSQRAADILSSHLKRIGKSNIQDSCGQPPLFQAMHRNHLPILNILLKNGADPHILHPTTRRNAFHIAAEKNADTVIARLHSIGVDSLKRDSEGFTPLHLAVFFRSQKVLRPIARIAKEKSSIDSLSSSGKTALTISIEQRNFEALLILLEEGANPMLEGANNALKVAERSHAFEAIPFIHRFTPKDRETLIVEAARNLAKRLGRKEVGSSVKHPEPVKQDKTLQNTLILLAVLIPIAWIIFNLFANESEPAASASSAPTPKPYTPSSYTFFCDELGDCYIGKSIQ